MKKWLLGIALVLTSCHKKPSDSSSQIVSMQLIDRNGFTETISNKDRLNPYQVTDFLSPQPYQKVLRVYGKDKVGKSSSKISSYHPNGHIWQLLEVVDGRAHGSYQEWYSNGIKRISSHIIEGLADINELAQTSWVFHGRNEVWDEKGNLMAQIDYDKGLLHSPSIYYYPNGQVMQILPYNQGKIDGEVVLYDEDGTVLESIPYLDGLKHGLAKGRFSEKIPAYEELYEKGTLLSATYYTPSGKEYGKIINGNGIRPTFEEGILTKSCEYQNGVQKGIVNLYFPNGEVHKSYYIIDGKKEKEEWEYYPDSTEKNPKPKLCVHWHEDQIEGQVKTWYENKALESQREIRKQKKQGLSFAWYPNGDIMLIEDYANDLLIKGSYFKKGDKKSVSTIEEGKGIATLYTNEGIFWKKISYEKGKPILYDDSASR